MQLGEQTYMMSNDKITGKLTSKQTIQVNVSWEITTQWRRDDLPEFTSQWKLRLRWSGAESQSELRIALIGHTESPSCCPPMRRSTSHYMMPLRSATKPLQGWGTHPQLNWRLSPIPPAPGAKEITKAGARHHNLIGGAQLVLATPRAKRTTNDELGLQPNHTLGGPSQEWRGKSNRFGGSVDLGLLLWFLEYQGVWVDREGDPWAWSLLQWWVLPFESW